MVDKRIKMEDVESRISDVVMDFNSCILKLIKKYMKSFPDLIIDNRLSIVIRETPYLLLDNSIKYIYDKKEEIKSIKNDNEYNWEILKNIIIEMIEIYEEDVEKNIKLFAKQHKSFIKRPEKFKEEVYNDIMNMISHMAKYKLLTLERKLLI